MQNLFNKTNFMKGNFLKWVNDRWDRFRKRTLSEYSDKTLGDMSEYTLGELGYDKEVENRKG